MTTSLLWGLGGAAVAALSVLFAIVTVLNALEYRVVRRGPIIDPATTELPDPNAGMPWHPKRRAQRWPDPLAVPPILTREAAGLHAEAAARRADNFRHVGETVIIVFALPLALVVNSAAASWPVAPGGGTWILAAVAGAGIWLGIRSKTTLADHWEVVAQMYAAAAEALSNEAATVAARPDRSRRTVAQRLIAAWRAFIS
ncbi:hypothetical protein GCM10029992_37260 [Glycomyces albus]